MRLPLEVRKIAVVRANGLGDYVFCLPALEALRHRFPNAEIVLLGRQWHREFLEGRPGPVDRVVPVPPARGVGEPDDVPQDESALESFFEAMCAERFDLAFQLHGGGRWSNPFVLRLGARRTYGLRSPDAVPLDAVVPYVYYQPEVFRYLEVVALAGAQAVCWEPRLQVTACDLEAARPLLPRNGPLVVLHLGATDPRRRWPISHFAAVGDALAEAGAKVVAIGGSGDERGLVEELQQAMQHAAIDIGADCSLHRLTGVLARAALVVGNDSGPLHLARAVGTPTVGIYWCGNLINAGPTVRTWHRQLLSWRLHCPECGANTTEHRCEHHPSFVADVPAGEAIREALDLLQQREDPCRASRPPNAYLEVMRAPSQERQEQALESPRTRA